MRPTACRVGMMTSSQAVTSPCRSSARASRFSTARASRRTAARARPRASVRPRPTGRAPGAVDGRAGAGSAPGKAGCGGSRSRGDERGPAASAAWESGAGEVAHAHEEFDIGGGPAPVSAAFPLGGTDAVTAFPGAERGGCHAQQPRDGPRGQPSVVPGRAGGARCDRAPSGRCVHAPSTGCVHAPFRCVHAHTIRRRNDACCRIAGGPGCVAPPEHSGSGGRGRFRSGWRRGPSGPRHPALGLPPAPDEEGHR